MRAPVIFYHKIDVPTPDIKIRGAFTSPKRFEKQLTYLKKNGVKFVTASELVRFFLDHGHFPERTLSLTFDDGWKDNYTNAFPILKRLDMPATIFLVPRVLGQKSAVVIAEGENAREHLSEENVREMAAGRIEFGSHSMNHALFNSISLSEAEKEAGESKRFIENLLQKECAMFAYPAGYFTEESKNAVKKAGYIGAFSTVYADDNDTDIFAINRTEILHRDHIPFRFSRKITSIFI